MDSKPVPLTASEEQRAWHLFRASPIQTVLHNEMLKQIEQCRTQLETAERENVIELQAKIKALRFVYGLIHRTN